MAYNKKYRESRNYIYKIVDLWMALQKSQRHQHRKIWPFPGFPGNEIIFISNKTQVYGLHGLADYIAKKTPTEEYSKWLLEHNRLLEVDWDKIDTAYRAAHSKFCEADIENHPMWFNSSWEYSPAWSLMSEKQTIAIEKTINQHFIINGY